jgi:hypothetical protein
MQVATTFLRAVVSGDSERALRMVGDDAPLYAEALPALARDAKRKHLRVVRFQRLGDGRFRYWMRGRERRASDGAIITVSGPFDIVVDDPSTGEVTNFQFLPDVEFKFP